MPDEESLSREVEEARFKVIEWVAALDDAADAMDFESDLVHLVAAVRKQERAQVFAEMRDAVDPAQWERMKQYSPDGAAPVEGGEG